MHPYQLEVMAAERRRELIAEADRHHVARRARYAAAAGPRPSARIVVVFAALAAYAQRCRRRLRIVFAADRSYLLDDRPIAGSSVPLWMWREEAARNREPNRGF